MTPADKWMKFQTAPYGSGYQMRCDPIDIKIARQRLAAFTGVSSRKGLLCIISLIPLNVSDG